MALKEVVAGKGCFRGEVPLQLRSSQKRLSRVGRAGTQMRRKADAAAAGRGLRMEVRRRFRGHRHAERRENREHDDGDAECAMHPVQS